MNKIFQFFSKTKTFGENVFTNFSTFLSGENVNTQNLLENNKHWVYVAVDKISSKMASIRLQVMKTNKSDDDDTEIWDHPLVDFLNMPHPRMTGKRFVYLNTAYKELTGNSFWKFDIKTGNKVSVIPLLPTKVNARIGKNYEILGYEYTNGVNKENLTFEEVLHDTYPSPKNPFWGQGPLSQIASWVDTDNYASEFNRLFFINGAQFGGFIESESDSKERIELIKVGLKNQHVGVKNAHKIGVLPKGAKFKEASSTLKDMQFTELDARYRDKILAGFGVPKHIAGITEDVNRANAEASEYTFCVNTIKPKMDMFIDFINTFIVPMFDKTGQIYVKYEDFIPEDRQLKIEERKVSLGNSPYKTINEVRLEDGLEPIEGGDVLPTNGFDFGSLVPVKTIKTKKKKKVFINRKASAMESMVEKLANIAKAKKVEAELKTKDLNARVVSGVQTKEFEANVDKFEKEIVDQVREYNDRQKALVLENVEKFISQGKGIKGSDIFDFKSEMGIMVNVVSPILLNLFTTQAIEEYVAQNFDGNFNTTEANVLRVIEVSANRMAKKYTNTSLKLLKHTINEGLQQGDGLKQIKDRVSSIYEFSNQTRSARIARTESFYVSNEASRQAYKQSGVVKTIKWYTSYNPCQFCAPLDGKIIDIESNFFEMGQTITGADGGSLDLNYRNIGVPPLHPNCNCFIKPEEIVIDKSAKKDIEVSPDEDIDEEIDKELNELLEND